MRWLQDLLFLVDPVQMWIRRKERKRCWHHDPVTGVSWVRSRLINTGAGKMFWCSKCERTVFV